MKINNDGLNLLKSLEGCSLTAYKLKGERNYTIGYGHSDNKIKKGDTIIQAKADELLKKDLEKFEKCVTNYAVKKFPDLNENMFSALVSYCYNRGLGGLKELLNASDTIAVLGWNITIYWGKNKNYQTALMNRRKKEQELFFKNYSTVTVPSYSTASILDLKVPTPTLRRGNMGREVEYLQKFLHIVKPDCESTTDGKFGPKTYDDLYDFQETRPACGKPDGIYGKHTRDVVKDIMSKMQR